jgi:hypothetical protein
MLRRNFGQTYTEYLVILASVLAIASIIVALFMTIGRRFQQQQSRIEALP